MSSTISATIGNTPLLKLVNLSKKTGVTLYAKQESRNPMGSVKCRIAVSMIEAAQSEGLINDETVIVEPTSGNTGLGLAKLVLTPAPEGMKGAIAEAHRILAESDNSFMPDQFANPANPEIHRQTTAKEIWRDSGENIDIFVAGVGTGGTITGVSEVLKTRNPAMHSVAVEPADSPVLSGGKPGPHKIQGIGAGFVPEILNRDIIDEVITVTNDEAIKAARMLALEEGVLCGISSGAACHAALLVAEREKNSGKTIVVVLPDTGERYLSTDLLEK